MLTFLGRMSLLAGVLLLAGCDTKYSTEACRHQVSMNLDAGRYDAVLASTCASPMQRGAAYLGRAGFDPLDVINVFVRTGVTSGPTPTQSDLTIYMSSLVSTVTDSSLSDLDSSIAQYGLASLSASTSSDTYKDAQFSLSLANMVKGLSLLKLIVSDSTGSLNLSCDVNGNGIVDNADAASCALIAASNISSGISLVCSNATYSPAAPADVLFTGKTGTYSGLITTLTGTATTACPAQYQNLLYKFNTTTYWVTATTPDQTCTDNTGASWPCPIERNNAPLDLVTVINTSIDNSLAAIGNASSAASATDLQTAIQNIKSSACPSTACTSTNIAAYLQTIH